MSITYGFIAGSIALVTSISFLGVFLLSLKEGVFRKYIFLLISLAVGALLGDAFIHLLPEIFEETENVHRASILVISGILAFFILEKFLHWHHHGEDVEVDDIHPMGKLILVSDGVHNFLDGVIIAASFMTSIPVGIATTLAVIFHEIPQEIGDFAVLVHSGYSKTKALLLNFYSGLLAFFGAIAFLLLGGMTAHLEEWLLPIAAGGFIYIAVADLIPELHKTKGKYLVGMQIFAVLIGIGIMLALTLVE